MHRRTFISSLALLPFIPVFKLPIKRHIRLILNNDCDMPELIGYLKRISTEGNYCDDAPEFIITDKIRVASNEPSGTGHMVEYDFRKGPDATPTFYTDCSSPRSTVSQTGYYLFLCVCLHQTKPIFTSPNPKYVFQIVETLPSTNIDVLARRVTETGPFLREAITNSPELVDNVPMIRS